MGHGYAGIDNELYTDPKTAMLFADAKDAIRQLLAALKTWPITDSPQWNGVPIRKAAVVTKFRLPAGRHRCAVPEPGPGELLVRMEASGLCHTDIQPAHGDRPVKPNPPFIPGHEGIGRVERLGAATVTPASTSGRSQPRWLTVACSRGSRRCAAGTGRRRHCAHGQRSPDGRGSGTRHSCQSSASSRAITTGQVREVPSRRPWC